MSNDAESLIVAELQYRLLYSIVVAGKSASFAENAMKKFLAHTPFMLPFNAIRHLAGTKMLAVVIRSSRMGNYTKLERAFAEVVKLNPDLSTCTPAELEKIHGIGPKTSRFFIIWTRPGARHAAIDTHVLKWLRFIGHAVPKSTPSGSKYERWEAVFLAEADRRKVTARDLDARIWDHCSSTRLAWTDVRLRHKWPADLHPIQTRNEHEPEPSRTTEQRRAGGSQSASFRSSTS